MGYYRPRKLLEVRRDFWKSEVERADRSGRTLYKASCQKMLVKTLAELEFLGV